MSEWHIISSEYPPQIGGVSDYTRSVAIGMAAEGDQVHVWCPPVHQPELEAQGVVIHRELGHIDSAALSRVGGALDHFPAPRRILVQWVPHGYGRRSMNVPFCLWLRKRVRCGDSLNLMIHEPGLSFGEGSWRQNVPAMVHRLMSMILLGSADRVWVSIPDWERRLRPFALGRKIAFEWLPIPSGIPVVEDAAAVRAIRRRFAAEGGSLVGHFGTYGALVVEGLEPVLKELASAPLPLSILLLGASSESYREGLIERVPSLASRVFATGALPAADVSCHLAACDVLVQPYIDGVTTRRTSVMAGLAHGKAIVTTTGRSTEPFWASSGAVELAPRGASAALAELVTRLCQDGEKRSRLEERAKELYRLRFDVSHVIAALRQAEAQETACAC